jgi:riboflavin kinase/FMN adenylyltransferase
LRILESLTSLGRDQLSKGIWVTLGNFDGLHLGHAALIERLKRKVSKGDGSSVVVTFEPHPKKIFRPEEPLQLLTSYEEKADLIYKSGVDYVVNMSFSRDLSTLGPVEFLEEKLNISNALRGIVVGHDFSFGANRSGGHQLLENYCVSRGIDFEVCPPFQIDKETVCSTLIRKLLLAGEVEKANKLLDRNYKLSGLVIKGAGRGKQIGFATANLSYRPDRLVPKRGVYLTRFKWRDFQYISVTNIGLNPTFEKDRKELSVECHILDFDQDIYGEMVELEFLAFLRDEKKFSSVNDLIIQIGQDVETAREKFNQSLTS